MQNHFCEETLKHKQMSATFGYSRHQIRDFKQMTPMQEQHQQHDHQLMGPSSQRNSVTSSTTSAQNNDENSLRSSPNSSVSFGTTSSSNSSLNNGYNSLNCSITSSTGSCVNCSNSSAVSSVSFCNGGAGAANLAAVAQTFKVLSISSPSPNQSSSLIDQQQPQKHQQPISPTWAPNNNMTNFNTSNQTTLSTSATYSSLQAKPLKCFESQSAYVEAMKEDLAEWLNRLYPDLDLTSANFFSRLETGSIVCRHANYVTNMGRKALASKLNDSLKAHSSKINCQINNENNNNHHHQIGVTNEGQTMNVKTSLESNNDKQRRLSNVALQQQQQRSRIPRSKSNFFTPSKSYSSLNILINNNNNNININANQNNKQHQTNSNTDDHQSPIKEANLAPTTTTQASPIINYNKFVSTTCQNGGVIAESPTQQWQHLDHKSHQYGSLVNTITTTPKNKHHMIDWIKVRVLSFKPDARPGTFFARDNICQFILWCRSLNILDCLLFETDDLVARKNERSFILCMLEVARIGFGVGVETPLIIQLEQEIDREIENEAKQRQINQDLQTATMNHQKENDDDKRNYVQLHEDDNAEADADSDAEYGPKPQVITNDLMSLHEKVVQLLCQCTCPTQFPMVRVGDNGKYKVGDKLIIFVRILRRHIMVRVGGGWQELSEFLRAKDPCRMRPPNQQCNNQHYSQTNCQLQSSLDWPTPSIINNQQQHCINKETRRMSNGSPSSGLMTIVNNHHSSDNKVFRNHNNNNNSNKCNTHNEHNCHPTRSMSGSASMNWLSHNSRC